jgi:hypothetical protein
MTSSCTTTKIYIATQFRVNIQADRVVIVSSLIAKIFNPSKSWTITIRPHLNDTLVYSVLIIVKCQLFAVRLLYSAFFDSVFSVSLNSFVQHLYYSVSVQPDPGNVFQVFGSHKTSIICSQ